MCINIKEDPWFPMPSTFKVRPKVSLKGIMVCDLIDPTTKSWLVEKILTGFNKEDVVPILSIPVSKFGLCDRLVWHHTINEEYSVKSGYRVAVNLIDNGALGRRG